MIKYALIPLITLCLASCTKTPKTETDSSPSKPVSTESKSVNLAIWSNYLSEDTLKEFKLKTNIEVNVSNFSSNEELLAKMQASQAGDAIYDVVVPSDYMVFSMAQLKLLLALNKSKLTNVANMDPRLMNRSFDSGNQYSLPFDSGTTGFAYNKKFVKTPLKSWKDFYSSKEIEGKMTVLDDVREVIGSVLKMNGKSLNNRNKKDIADARDFLIKKRKVFRAFTSEPLSDLVSGDVYAAQVYASDALQAAAQSAGDVVYVIPSEGCTFYVDNLAIAANTKKVDEAHALIDFLLSAEVMKRSTEKLFLTPSNQLVPKLLSKELIENPGVFPPKDVEIKLELMDDLGEDMAMYEDAWTKIKVEK